MSVAFFAGSFDPFTVGHKSIVDRALPHFERIVVGVGFNVRKPGSREDAARRASHISRLYAGDDRVEAVSYSGLTTDAAKSHGADVLLRGVRSCSDFEYERGMADVNRRIGGMETMLIFALPEYDSISSSMVRELEAFGADTTPFVP